MRITWEAAARTWRRLGWSLRPNHGARELDEEMRFHHEMLTRDFEAAGLSPSDARDAARRQFGNALAMRERGADAWTFAWLDDLAHDVRFGLRQLRRNPLFALIAIVAIGLAIGINSGFFTLIDTFAWQPIPVPHAEQLVRMAVRFDRGANSILFSYPQVQAIARNSQTVADALPLGRCSQVAFRSSASAAAVPATVACVSGNFFQSLGGSAAIGRPLVPSDERDDATPAIAISDGFWTRAFARAPDVVGRDVIVNGAHATVVGVIRANFVGFVPITPDFWTTLQAASRVGATPGALTDPTNQFIDMKARLRAGVTLERATAEVSGVIAAAPPPTVRADAPHVAGVELRANGSMLAMTWQMVLVLAPALIVVALVLVIACANLANLLLSRSLARQREIAVRLAIGASRARLVRQLLTESLLIAVLGSALGFQLGRWTVTIVSRMYFSNLPSTFGAIALDLRPSWRVVAYTVTLGVVSVLAFGLAPALQATGANLTGSLKGDDTMIGSRVRRSHLRDALISVEVAGSLVLLVAAAILLMSIRAIGTRDAGFEPERVSVASLGLSAIGRVPPALVDTRATFAFRAARVPGVVETARALDAPFTSWRLITLSATGGSYVRLPYNAITTRYFDVVGQRIVSGRAFTPEDSAAESAVAIVSAAAARVLWPSSSALGQTLRAAQRTDEPDKLYRVVGIAADAHAGMIWDSDDAGYVFLPATPKDFASFDMPLLARSDTPEPVLARAFEDIARQIDVNAPIHVEPAIAQRDFMLVPIRYGSWITSAVGAFGLGLALIGLYGVVAFAVEQRRHEIAVHVALGAASADVLRLVVRREMRLVVIGLVVGLALSLGESKLIEAWAVPLSPLGIGGFAALASLLLGVALVASVIPALGALRIAPMQVLRRD